MQILVTLCYPNFYFSLKKINGCSKGISLRNILEKKNYEKKKVIDIFFLRNFVYKSNTFFLLKKSPLANV